MHLEARSLFKSFGAVTAVRGVDLDVAPGETVALLGPNGAGKSTFVDLVLGLGVPDSGSVRLGGRTPQDAVAAGLVGGMLQLGMLVRDLRVRELVAMVAAAYPEPLGVDEVLARTRITSFADRRTQHLSGGQAQRVRLALALVGDPRLLVLDEPTVAMDVEARHEFWLAMRDVAARDRTILFATHHLDEADAHAGRIVVMAGGAVVADGPTNEIKARVGVRSITATLPGVDVAELTDRCGAAHGARRGDVVELVSVDADSVLRRLLGDHPEARDIEVRSAGLEAAFLELTGAGAGR